MLVGYARVSTQEQDLALQLDALTAAGCAKVYEEKASGAQRERPELKAALGYMRQGDTLVVWKLDRLARSLKQLIETVETMGEQGIGLRSLTEAIDTTTSGGRLVFHLFAALAEFERGVIRERTLAGLQAARARGRTGGRPPALKPKDRRRQGAAARPRDHRGRGREAPGRALKPPPWLRSSANPALSAQVRHGTVLDASRVIAELPRRRPGPPPERMMKRA